MLILVVVAIAFLLLKQLKKVYKDFFNPNHYLVEKRTKTPLHDEIVSYLYVPKDGTPPRWVQDPSQASGLTRVFSSEYTRSLNDATLFRDFIDQTITTTYRQVDQALAIKKYEQSNRRHPEVPEKE